ncbi:hypothetical protein E2C01_065899 [Portunus trituberculatus]|uniref:Uncharacterized protein n=1 Tax=Portunus trituberculatus TaxID=210409 RepID=A0A5B7HPN7_PORTR|nr:hypothetical protein [Portunus trituberculatus]
MSDKRKSRVFRPQGTVTKEACVQQSQSPTTRRATSCPQHFTTHHSREVTGTHATASYTIQCFYGKCVSVCRAERKDNNLREDNKTKRGSECRLVAMNAMPLSVRAHVWPSPPPSLDTPPPLTPSPFPLAIPHPISQSLFLPIPSL